MKWLEEDLSGVRIYEKIQEKGVKAGYSTVKDYIAQIKREKKHLYGCMLSRERKDMLILVI